MEDGNVAIPLCLITGGGRGDGCVRLILSIDHRSTYSSSLLNHWYK